MALKEWLCSKEAANIIGVTVRTLYNWKKRNYGPRAYEYETVTRYRSSDVVSWRDNHITLAA